MPNDIVQFEVEILSFTSIRSRTVWPESAGPWIEGGLEDLMVHFTYASWTAHNQGHAISLIITSSEENLGKALSAMMTNMMEYMGAITLVEIRLTREALDELKRDRLEP
ncbi:MAG: hypothetical protein LUQ47_05835 [Methanotrichaceae archaeon]|nr:hypothetical protein [Methanotrichaceae archaeon]